MIGKRCSTTLFGGASAIVGASVFVTTEEGGLLAGTFTTSRTRPQRRTIVTGCSSPSWQPKDGATSCVRW